MIPSTRRLPWGKAAQVVDDLTGTIPAVALGLILNILDAMSYGYIVFPISDPAFAKYGGDGISIFMFSTLISQVVFTTMSVFKCGVGSMIIEVIPFLHSMARDVVGVIGEEGDYMPTVMAAFIMSTVMTSLAFFALGYFRLGNVMGFFPRHILVGSIGGVGYFLIQTALEVTGHVKLDWSPQGLKNMFAGHAPYQWGSALAAAMVLRLALQLGLDAKILGRNPRRRALFVPGFFLLLPVVFHGIIYCMGYTVEWARANGWLFDIPQSDSVLDYFQHIRPSAVQWPIVFSLIPTMASLSFFSVLHVPINVPALSVSTHTAVSVNRELGNHGVSNLISAAFGSVQNYLVYSTSVMAARSGGDHRAFGYLLTLVTIVFWVCGASLFALLPALVVGALMFHLGIDLLKEAVWDPLGMATPLEYSTIWLIIVAMAVLGFSEGVGVGILAACVFFVSTYSARARDAVIAAEHRGTLWGTPVRRMPAHHTYLSTAEAQHAVRTLELHGFLFFGTIHHLTRRIGQIVRRPKDPASADAIKRARRRIIWPAPIDGNADEVDDCGADDDLHHYHTIQWLVLDFSRCQDIDFSAGEAFVKAQRMLAARGITLVLAACKPHIAQALQRAGVWPDGSDDLLVTVSTVADALEWCENAMLRSYRPTEPQAATAPEAPPSTLPPDLAALATMLLADADAACVLSTTVGDPAVPLMERMDPIRGTVLWRAAGPPADTCAFILSGALCESRLAPDEVAEADPPLSPTITYLAGTVVGGMDFVAAEPHRNACWAAGANTVVYLLRAERVAALSPTERELLVKLLVRAARK